METTSPAPSEFVRLDRHLKEARCPGRPAATQVRTRSAGTSYGHADKFFSHQWVSRVAGREFCHCCRPTNVQLGILCVQAIFSTGLIGRSMEIEQFAVFGQGLEAV